MSYYRPSASRRIRSSASIPSAIIVILLIGVATVIVEGWWAMLMLGIAHSFDSRIPAFGFGATVFLAMALSSVVAMGAASVSRK